MCACVNYLLYHSLQIKIFTTLLHLINDVMTSYMTTGAPYSWVLISKTVMRHRSGRSRCERGTDRYCRRQLTLGMSVRVQVTIIIIVINIEINNFDFSYVILVRSSTSSSPSTSSGSVSNCRHPSIDMASALPAACRLRLLRWLAVVARSDTLYGRKQNTYRYV